MGWVGLLGFLLSPISAILTQWPGYLLTLTDICSGYDWTDFLNVNDFMPAVFTPKVSE